MSKKYQDHCDEEAVIVEKLESMARDIAEIKTQVKVTNGRVSQIELWRARMEGVSAAMNWLPTLAVGIATGGLTSLLVHLTN